MPARLNPVPDGVACVIVMLADPLFVTVTLCDPVLPTETFPKLALLGAIMIDGEEGLEFELLPPGFIPFALVRPKQPVKARHVSKVAANTMKVNGLRLIIASAEGGSAPALDLVLGFKGFCIITKGA